MGETSGITEMMLVSSDKEHILKVTFEDFQKAKLEIRPSAMREVWLMP